MSQQINLYNRAFLPKRELLTAGSLAVSATLLLSVVIAAASWASSSAREWATRLTAAETEQKAAQARMETARLASGQRKPSTALQGEIAERKALLAMREEVLTAMRGSTTGDDGRPPGFSEYLRGLARQSVNGLWLTGFTVDAGGSGMAINGKTIDKSLLPDYVRRLNAEKAFVGKSFAALNMDARTDPGAGSGGVKSTAAVPPAPNSAVSPAIPSWIEFRLAATVAEPETKR